MTKSSIPGGPRTLTDLEREFPWIPWREPQAIQEAGHIEECRYACPVCVANQGLGPVDVLDLSSDPREVSQHIMLEHAR